MTTTTASQGKTTTWKTLAPGIELSAGAWGPRTEKLLTPEALGLLARNHRALQSERRALLGARAERQRLWDAGGTPEYLDGEIADLAVGDWKIAPLPDDLLRRRVEITGPVNDRKMVINMLSRTAAGDRADAAMLDFEDSMKPSWGNVVSGMENLIGAAEGDLTFVKPASGDQPEKLYQLDPDDMPLLMARCRGLHLEEANLRIDGEPVSAGLFDLSVAACHVAERLMKRGKTPKCYVPKVEHHLEARWWDDLLGRIETGLEIPKGTLRVTLLIETLPAAFQMEEILYELRGRIAGLNVGRWDKIFSDIKVLKAHSDRVLADRASISLNRPWMKNYAARLIKICHRHGAFAMGGMAAFTPGGTPERRAEQTRKVVDDKKFEFTLGHDGCWVSHPYFIAPAMSAFTRDNQLDVIPDIDDRPELLPEATPPLTLDGLRKNARVGIAYVKGWNQDIGCVAWDDLMEDLATLEISRAQTWQWLHNSVKLESGEKVSRELVERVFDEELEKIRGEIRAAMAGRDEDAVEREVAAFEKARADAGAIFTESEFRPFLSTSSDLARSTG
jgi:malate synthase